MIVYRFILQKWLFRALHAKTILQAANRLPVQPVKKSFQGGDVTVVDMLMFPSTFGGTPSTILVHTPQDSTTRAFEATQRDGHPSHNGTGRYRCFECLWHKCSLRLALELVGTAVT